MAEQLEPLKTTSHLVSEEEIQEMLVLARRLRAQAGGDLDDDAILAVAEATGSSPDWVRLALRSIPEEQKRESIIDRLKSSYYAFSPDHRRLVIAGIIGLSMGMAMFLSAFTQDSGGLWNILALIGAFGALVNASLARSIKTAIGSGTISGALSILFLAFLFFIFNMIVPGFKYSIGTTAFLFTTFGGLFLSAVGHSLFSKNREKLGFANPAADRHALIQQMMDIQSRLKSDEKFVTFLSVDMVGSTRIKSENDPLSVEFTFNEYHTFVESLVMRHGGKVHSTAGDGVTAVFDEPRAAFACGKALQGGLFEFNAFRNKLKSEVTLRAGMHTGNILAPGREATSVNFAHVIDIAAHMQKEAPIGALVVSEETAMYFGGLTAVSQETVVVDNLRAAVWRPRRSFGEVVQTESAPEPGSKTEA